MNDKASGKDTYIFILLLLAAFLAASGVCYFFKAQFFVYAAVAGLFVVAEFWILIRQNRKKVKEKETEIRYREQLFNILAVNTNDVFLMLSAEDYSVEYVSPNIERVLGFTQDAVKEDVRVLGRAAYSNGRKMDFDVMDRVESDKPLVLEAERIHNQSGEQRWFLETVYRERINDSYKFIVVLSDRTQERRSRKALEEALNSARVANESKSIFLSNMSHDIRTPMNAIVGLSTLLQRDAGNPEKVREHTKKITTSSRNLLGLINDILEMSKIENGKTTLNVMEINLAEMIDELGIIIRPQAKAKQQKFEISVYDICSEYLLGDKLRINQVLINILSNAVKYTPVGGSVEMEVRQLSQKTRNYARFQFVVKDSGVGMQADYLERIFDPFTRDENSTENMAQGTSLGMAIARNLVDLMGGTIDVESVPGQGSTFTVNLELRIKEQTADADFWKRNGVTHVLITGEEEESCTGLTGAMEGTGVAAEYASGTDNAVAMIQNAHESGRDFDLVLLERRTDCGLETAKALRQVLPTNTPMILLSACDWNGTEEEAAAAGIKGFLSRPFFLSNFRRVVEELRNTEDKQDIAAKEGALKGKHFLVAEDNELNSEILSELLDMSEATCDIAANGLSAFEMFENSGAGKYDMILMDVRMPVMNGYEATRAIRNCSHPHAKTIPIIAMTANAFAEDVRDALDAGMDAHIAKPVDMGRLEMEAAEIFARGVIH